MKNLKEFSGDIQTSEISGPISSLMGGQAGNTSTLFNRADHEQYLTNQAEVNYARSQPSVPFYEAFASASQPSPAPQAAGIFSGISILFLLPLAVAAGMIMIKIINEKPIKK